MAPVDDDGVADEDVCGVVGEVCTCMSTFMRSIVEVSADNFGLNRIEEGMLTTSWNTAEGMSIASGEVVFSLIVEATEAASLSDAITVNSRITAAEAYNSADQVHDVSLSFTNGLVETGFALYQNEPNPFKEVTQMPGSKFFFHVFDEDGIAHCVPLHRVREVYKDGELIWKRDPEEQK